MNTTPLHTDDDTDDEPVGHVLTRRQALGLFSAPALLWLAGCSMTAADDANDTPLTGSCIARPELTEGPYYVDENLNRSDIRTDTATGTVSAGTVLALAFNVSRVTGSTCEPLAGAIVDVWHADALGVYSDVGSAQGQDFLRGLQVTDASGLAQFTTVYPGWYPGRAVHIHFKVRSAASATQTYEFTSQLFFDDAFTDAVYGQAPYASRGARTTRNASDGIYGQSAGQTLVAATQNSAGVAASFDIALTI